MSFNYDQHDLFPLSFIQQIVLRFDRNNYQQADQIQLKSSALYISIELPNFFNIPLIFVLYNSSPLFHYQLTEYFDPPLVEKSKKQ